MGYPNSVSFIEFLMDFCIYGDNLGTTLITDKKLLGTVVWEKIHRWIFSCENCLW